MTFFVFSGLPGDYHMPFEDEVGLHPTLEEMQDVVISSRKRPQFKPHWLKNEVVYLFLFLLSSVLLTYFSICSICRLLTSCLGRTRAFEKS